MSKILKYVSVVFLWVATIMLGAHLLIPHDHHISETFLDLNENCPATTHGNEHHSGFPDHCHAFNDLASEKLRPFRCSENIQFTISSLSILTGNSFLFLPDSFNNFNEFPDLFLKEYALISNSLRAPPASA